MSSHLRCVEQSRPFSASVLPYSSPKIWISKCRAWLAPKAAKMVETPAVSDSPQPGCHKFEWSCSACHTYRCNTAPSRRKAGPPFSTRTTSFVQQPIPSRSLAGTHPCARSLGDHLHEEDGRAHHLGGHVRVGHLQLLMWSKVTCKKVPKVETRMRCANRSNMKNKDPAASAKKACAPFW